MNTIYAGTGEGFYNLDARRGLGIFKTTDGSTSSPMKLTNSLGGTTWTHLSSTNNSNFYYINKIQISPTQNNIVYAATSTGIFKSIDNSTFNQNAILK